MPIGPELREAVVQHVFLLRLEGVLPDPPPPVCDNSTIALDDADMEEVTPLDSGRSPIRS